MRVLVAMSGGVDSSVAAAELQAAGHDVVGATMKLWGGPSDSGCCSVADVEDARRVAQQLGIRHHVFNFTAEFDRFVVDPYVGEHRAGRTPNPCIECNRHLKFDRFLRRALQLGFDAVATGHHARVARDGAGWSLLRGADAAKDQSYVLSMLGQAQLSRTLLPVGTLTKDEVRRRAAARGLRTAAKPDSQDVCFVTAAGRAAFLAGRTALRPGRLVDAATGAEVGRVDAVELVTVGQRRGMGRSADGSRRYAVGVDVSAGTVRLGGIADLLVTRLEVGPFVWTGDPVRPGTAVVAQMSAHGAPVPAVVGESGAVELGVPVRRVAPGQTVALYEGARVLGSAVVA